MNLIYGGKLIGKTVEILLVEDNPADARLVMEVFKDFKLNNKLYHVKDGVEAMDYLHHNDE